MSDELRELYQEVILDHGRKPRNFGPLEEANRHADGYNPLCGDQVQVHAQVEDGIVRAVRFEGAGCAISTASASLMTQALTGSHSVQIRPRRILPIPPPSSLRCCEVLIFTLPFE